MKSFRSFPSLRFQFLSILLLLTAGSSAQANGRLYHVITLAGAIYDGSVDGTGISARFSAPSGTAVDGAGNIYVADAGNDTIRKITPRGVVSTLAVMPGVPGRSDGPENVARFHTPRGVTLDRANSGAVGLDSVPTLPQLITARSFREKHATFKMNRTRRLGV